MKVPSNIRVATFKDIMSLNTEDLVKSQFDELIYGRRYIGEIDGVIIRVDPVKVRVKKTGKQIEYLYYDPTQPSNT